MHTLWRSVVCNPADFVSLTMRLSLARTHVSLEKILIDCNAAVESGFAWKEVISISAEYCRYSVTRCEARENLFLYFDRPLEWRAATFQHFFPPLPFFFGFMSVPK